MAAHFKVIWLHLCNGTHPIRYFTCCCRFTENLLCILKIKHIYLLHTVGQLCVQILHCRRWGSFYLPLSGFMQRRTYSCVRNLMSLLAMAHLHTPCIFQYINIWHFYLKFTWAASVYLYRVASESHQAYLYYSYIVLYYLCI